MEQQTLMKGAGNLKLVLSLFVFGVLVTGAAVMYGRMDTGIIDVSATISNANQASQAAGEDPSNQVVQPSSEIFNTLPNGGLVGTGKAEPTPPPAEPASTTPEGEASTTPEVGTATEATTTLETQTESAPENGTE